MLISDWSSDVCSSDLLLGPSALAPRVKQPREGQRLGNIVGLDSEQAAERQVGEIEPLLGAKLRNRRRQPVEQFALRIDEEAVRAAFGFEFLNVDRIARDAEHAAALRLEEHTSELQSLMRIPYAVLCLKQITLLYYSHLHTT